jgi:long-chain fatty acid transport protein
MRNSLLAAAVLLGPASAFAGGYIVPNTNPRDMGMADSAVAAQNSAAATVKNPAALAGQEGFDISVSGSLIDLESTWNDTFGISAKKNDSASLATRPAYPPTAFASYGGKYNDMGYGVGVGLSIPGGGQVYWPGGWTGATQVTSVDRRIYGIYAMLAIQPIKQIKLGGGLVYYRGTEHLTQDINFLGQTGGAELGTAGGAPSFDLSTEITPVADLPLTIGIDYKHQAVINFSGFAHFDNAPAALKPSALDQSVTHALTFPNQLNAGIAYRPIAPLLVSAGFTFERFVVYREDAFIGSLGTSVIVPRDYHNGQTYRLGAEYTVLPALKVRAGVLRDIAPTNTDRLNPSIPDANSTAVTVGATFNLTPNLELSAAYFFDKEDTTTTTSVDTFQGSYDTHSNILSVGIAYRIK